MTNRLDQLPENQFTEALKKARQDLEGLKNAQTSGSDSNRVYYLLTDQPWDFYVDANPGQGADFFFQYDWVHQDYGYGIVSAVVYKDVVDLAHRLQVGDVGARDFFSSVYPPVSEAAARQIGWQLGVSYNDDSVMHRYYYKLYYLTTDTVE